LEWQVEIDELKHCPDSNTPDGASPIRRIGNPTEESTVFWWQLSS
jgi:hypothetical protein